MHISCGPVLISLLPCIVLLTAAASIPSQGSKSNNSSFMPSSTNVSAIGPGSVLANPVVPFSYRDIEFNFSTFGGNIPKREIEKLLTGADEVITQIVDEHPLAPIPNHGFEYRAPGGNALLAIRASIGKTMSWGQLFRLLQGLYRFMIGKGRQQEHCRVLEFEVAIAGRPEIGLGVVWYFPPTIRGNVEMATNTSTTAFIKTRSLQLPDSAIASSRSTIYDVNIVWPIPKTTLTLNFYFLGMPIPDDKLKRTLQAATIAVRRYLNTPYENDGIDHGVFQEELPPSGDGTTTGVTVFAYWEHDVTWRQLSNVLSGLLTFTTTFRADLSLHYQVLGFKIKSESDGLIGVGSLWHYPRRALEAEKRAETVNSTQEPPSAASSVSTPVALIATPAPIHFTIPGTQDSLTFTSFGRTLHPSKARDALNWVLNDISAFARSIPQSRVPRNKFIYEDGQGISITILASNTQIMTWSQLNKILIGLRCFMTGINPMAGGDQKSHYQELTFSIFMQKQGYLGYGVVGFKFSSKTAVSRRSASPPSLEPPLNKTTAPAAPPISFPIINTSLTIIFVDLGTFSIPIPTITEFFPAVLESIQPSVNSSPNRPITPHLWFFKMQNPRGAILSISIYTRSTTSLSWIQLQKILKGLEVFMVAQRTTLVFDIDLDDNGPIAEGLVWYTPYRSLTHTQSLKRSTAFPLQLPPSSNETNSSPLSTTSLPKTTTYPIPSTPIILRIKPNGRPIPPLYFHASLTTYLNRIAHNVSTRPDDPIPENALLSRDPMSGVAFLYLGYGELLSWRQANWVLGGLLNFVNERPRMCREMAVEVDVVREGQAAGIRYGGVIVWYSGSEVG